MRLFVAVNIPDALKAKIGGMAKTLDMPGLRRTSEKNLHLTLKFLGDVSEDKLTGVVAALRRVSLHPFKASIGDYGFFPDSRNIRVVWLGLARGREEMAKLHWIIDEALAREGFARERNFESHLTVARASFLKDKGLLLQRMQGFDFMGEFEVSGFDLMESFLKQGGPEYRVVSSFNLG
ncbi:MAG: RNA 2',3'-cyclic phosphodiesterase [Candidatus Aenigmarchaeota archaeon]|nr:RNA 2',3'-cyclic phosphodiesterase [Candidatus Aenigmarchaeota archaeon]